MLSELIERLAGIVGAGHVLTGDRCARYAVDGKMPKAVAAPASIEELSDIMKLASSEQTSVVPWGSGTKINLGGVPTRVDLVVGLWRLNRVIDHEPADLTATFEGGALLRDIQAYLAQRGQFLPIDPPFANQATIGGIVATNSSGPRRLRYGACRDLMIGVRVVHVDGTITKGGAKVVKNVSGYDMNKLYVGSLGTVGVIVEATFKIYPLPQKERTWAASFREGEAAASAVELIMASTIVPSRVELLFPPTAQLIGRQAGLSFPQGSVALASSVGSVPEAVDAQIGAIQKICEQCGSEVGVPLDADADERFWGAIGNFPSPNGHEGMSAILKASVLPTRVLGTIRRAEEIARSTRLQSAAISEPGSGIVRFHWSGDAGSPEVIASALAGGIEALRQSIIEDRGSLVVLSAPLAVKSQIDVWGPVGSGLSLMRELKQQFDPQNLLNPGRFVGGM